MECTCAFPLHISMPEDIPPTNPIPTNPIPTNPIPTNPIPTNPIPTNPIPTNPIPTAQTTPAQTTPAQTTQNPTSITLEDFRHFYLAKSCDVIGQGTFRRHLCRCKEAGDPWAVEMNLGVTKVHLAVRGVQSRVSQIPKPRNAMLQSLCRNVMVGAQPPIKMYAGYTTCCLSGVSCNMCIDLTRPAKNAQYIHIHARFSHFFLMLWYCSKLEYVVRSCAKAWMERQDVRDEANFREMCEAFTAETKDYCGQLHEIFVRSLSHVHKTLDVLMHYSLDHRVLDCLVGEEK